MHAEEILVMKEGVLVEQGTHVDLIALDGEYAGFWKAQTEI